MTPAHVILGGNRQLTYKQKQFARNLVEGMTKTEAYAQAYKHKGKRKTMSDNASRLSKDSRIEAEVEALERAKQYLDYHNSAQKIAELRSLVVSQLTKEALDPASPPNARIQALAKLGSVSELQVFTERKVVTTVKDSDSARKDLMDQLKRALGEEMRTITAEEDEDELELMQVISAPPKEIPVSSTPPEGDPPFEQIDGTPLLHSIPDKRLPLETLPGEGDTKIHPDWQELDTEKAPPMNSKQKG